MALAHKDNWKPYSAEGGPVYRMDGVLPLSEEDFKTLGSDYKRLGDMVKEKLEQFLYPHVKQYVWQIERGKELKKLHVQMYVQLHDKMRPVALGGLVGKKLPGINFRHASENGVKGGIQRYCAKADERYYGPVTNMNLEQYVKPTGWDIEEIRKNPLPWQKQIIDAITPKCRNDRIIDWIYDKHGKSGKTKLCKMLQVDLNASILQYGSLRDLAYRVVKEGQKAAYFIDLTRTQPNGVMDDMYAMLEQLKNGVINNGKYEGSMLNMDPPHVWVMANMPTNIKKMSADP